MEIRIPRGVSDEVIDGILGALRAYGADHDQAEMELYRQNGVSIRIRIVDPTFRGREKSQRHAEVWKYLGQLPEDQQSDVSMLLLLTPEETKTSLANLEFNDPVPSNL